MVSRARAPRVSPVSELQSLRDKVHRLETDLFVARDALIYLLDARDLLSGFYGIRDRSQLREWREATATKVIEAAWVRPGEEMGDARWPRALCPLCRQGADARRDVRGFAVPNGLRRHLLGELNSRQCPVFGAAEGMARSRIENAESGKWTPSWSSV
ncbi:hypothetical protein [Paraburkholderia phosphatilytica]|uniref:hypothetical protein n=1 Tax=Paraburkholderia phosphatilytica TaxID=2282883 RepID=UPI000F5F5909|nr:hypothetical protein [Paraburkholderia phosphatilytica]